MSRYEGRFERTFYKALKELQRIQALRAAVSDSAIGTVSQNPISPDSAPQIPPPPEAARSEIRKKSEIHPPSAPEAAESDTRNPKSEIRNPSRVSESPLSKPGFATLEDS